MQKGYDRDICSISPGEPHSIQDLDRYLSSGIPRNVADDMAGKGRVVEIHRCTDIESLKSLQDRGFTDTSLVKKPYVVGGGSAGGSLLLQTRSPETGEVRYCLTNVIGSDMNTHNQLQLKLSGVDGRNVLVFDHHSDNSLLFENALDKVGDMPRKVVMGYRGHFKREIAKRAICRQKLEQLQEKFGPDAFAGMLRELKALSAEKKGNSRLQILNVIRELEGHEDSYGKLLSVPPGEVFRKGSLAEKMGECENFLKDLASENPESGLLTQLFKDGHLKCGRMNPDTCWAGENIEDIFFPSQLFTFITKDGQREKMLVTRVRYGDLAGTAVKALINRGAQEIIYVGNAGTLAQDGTIGELQFPSLIYDQKGNPVNPSLRNDLGEFVKQKGTNDGQVTLRLSTKHKKVSSPLVETEQCIQDLKNQGFQGLDVETADIAKVVSAERQRGNPVRLSTVILSSDVPGRGQGQTIENMRKNEEAEEKYQKAFGVVVDNLLEYWGMEDVDLSDSDDHSMKQGASLSASMPSKLQILRDMKTILCKKYRICRKDSGALTDPAFETARKILQEARLDDEDHMLLKENIATFLQNGMSSGRLRRLSLEPHPDASRVSHWFENPRWLKKFNRDMQNPYTDREVFRHIEELDHSLKASIRNIVKHTARFPGKVYVMGSFARGRLGASSDLDVVMDVESREMREKLYDEYSRKRREGIQDEVMVSLFSENSSCKRFEEKKWGRIIDLGHGSRLAGAQSLLVREYSQVLEDRGYSVSKDFHVTQKEKKPRETEAHWFNEHVVQRLVERNERSYMARGRESTIVATAKETAGATVGAALLLPVIGTGIEKIIHWLTS